ncbi:MAG: hypothetical protein J0626_11460, partial [Rhodospirillaceae bacterium]|nr:hypothetical protein [Rhodospirillaceae bacterium]
MHPDQESSQDQAVAALRDELLSKVGNDRSIAAELAHSLHVAGHEAAGKQPRLGGKAFGNDFGPDTG